LPMFDFGSMTPYHFDFTREWIEARRQAALARGMAEIVIRDWFYDDGTLLPDESILRKSRTLIFRDDFYKPSPPGQPQNEKVIRAQAEFDSFDFQKRVQFHVYSNFACYDFVDQETDVHHSATLLKITTSAKIIRGLSTIQHMWKLRLALLGIAEIRKPFRMAVLMATDPKFAGPKNLEWSLSDLDPYMIATIASKCFPHCAPRSRSQ
jgi:hypothetical protein